MKSRIIFIAAVIAALVIVQIVRAQSATSSARSTIAGQTVLISSVLVVAFIFSLAVLSTRSGSNSDRTRLLRRQHRNSVVMSVHAWPESFSTFGLEVVETLNQDSSLSLIASATNLQFWAGEATPNLIITVDWKDVDGISLNETSYSASLPSAIDLFTTESHRQPITFSLDSPFGESYPSKPRDGNALLSKLNGLMTASTENRTRP